MSETILKILLSELQTVRITCKNPACGAVLETPLARLSHYLPSTACRYCNQPLLPGNKSPLITLADTMKTITDAASQVQIEFVLPVPPNAK